ncbi:bifunctional precorrin-2 dehydrogenase/sirohydrochlorin ferrochelatase [Paenibacillus sp. J5C_2022]|uniref:precorrin-2 dehydrogenase/sirohydrochlorin ferrochelatase family protein n=1 Tax=Paenibacillus sp. J5C2022 TaxID=2977129 RepID=UPI0021D35715|nr:bifunctional precorrin-2 dehydrogenase/sirohydrochlorin ferrochelatase [Paenibacillus sp. J5C2022]MCU6711077.1 bifunctional precorrin-2 dehydrogenase/sirohydrochlorin ferrochelatase [Paenibacillus sp. J5C2022]
MSETTPSDYYPIMMRLQGKRCLIVGGGPVAERKLEGLLAAAADDIVLVSPDATTEIEKLAAAGRLRWERRRYREEDLAGAWLVFAATGDKELNASIGRLAECSGRLTNVAHESELGSFITPSILRRGELLMTVTASGNSPSFSRLLRKELEEHYGDEYGRAVERLGQLRELALEQLADGKLRRAVLEQAAGEALAGGNEHNDIQQWLNELADKIRGR